MIPARRWATVLVAILLLGPGSVRAQTEAGPRVRARVRQVAGATVYVDLGTDHGLAVGDTVAVFRDGEGPSLGRLAVTVASPVRSVLAFAGPPFAIARGEVLRIDLLRPYRVAPPEVDPPSPASPDPAAPSPDPDTPPAAAGRAPAATVAARPAARPSPLGPRAASSGTPAHGWWGLEMAVSRSSATLGTGVDPVDVSRTYATPALRFDVRAPAAVAGFDLRLSTRTTYRYGTDPGFDPEWAPRVYEASLERRFDGAPVELRLGRFHTPGESFSGYWDGVSLRLGGEGIGVGFLGGLQPDRWNQLPTSELPKAAVFVDFDRRAGDLRWRGDVSAHMAWPSNGAPTHTWFGVGQRLTVGRVRLRQEVQVDRDPFAGGLHLSRLVARADLELSDAVGLRGGISRRASYSVWALDPGDVLSPGRDRADVGLSLRGRSAFATVDVGLNRDVAGRVTRSATASLSLPRALGPVGTVVAASWWEGEMGRAVSVAPGFSWRVGAARMRAGYRFHDSDVLGRRRTTHAPDLSLDVPFAGGLRASIHLRGRWGEGVRSEYLRIDLSRVF